MQTRSAPSQQVKAAVDMDAKSSAHVTGNIPIRGGVWTLPTNSAVKRDKLEPLLPLKFFLLLLRLLLQC